MSHTKTDFKFFTIPEYDKEQEYLRRMHSTGWKLTRVGFPCFYHFEACEPEDVIYQLDYNQEGAAHRDEYVQMFRDCGWEYLFDFVGYSYFRKPAAIMDGTEEIFCDDDSRLDMMKRVFRGRMIPLIICFCCIILPQLAMRLLNFDADDSVQVFLIGLFGTMFVLYLVLIVQYALQYRSYKKRIKH